MENRSNIEDTDQGTDWKSKLDKLKEVLSSEPEAGAAEEEVKELEWSKQGFRRNLFVTEYMIDFNGAAAARRAGYSEATAKSIASELLTDPDIKREIKRRQAQLIQRSELSKDYIIQTLYKVIEDSDVADDRNAVLKAIDIMNKMMGNYSQTITNINLNDVPLFPDVDITDAQEVKD